MGVGGGADASAWCDFDELGVLDVEILQLVVQYAIVGCRIDKKGWSWMLDDG